MINIILITLIIQQAIGSDWEQFVHRDLRTICSDYEDNGISPKEENRMDIDAAVNDLIDDTKNKDDLHIWSSLARYSRHFIRHQMTTIQQFRTVLTLEAVFQHPSVKSP